MMALGKSSGQCECRSRVPGIIGARYNLRWLANERRALLSSQVTPPTHVARPLANHGVPNRNSRDKSYTAVSNIPNSEQVSCITVHDDFLDTHSDPRQGGHMTEAMIGFATHTVGAGAEGAKGAAASLRSLTTCIQFTNKRGLVPRVTTRVASGFRALPIASMKTTPG